MITHPLVHLLQHLSQKLVREIGVPRVSDVNDFVDETDVQEFGGGEAFGHYQGFVRF